MKTLAAILAPAVGLLLASCGSVLQPVKDTSVNHLLDPLVPESPLTASSPAIAIARPSLPGYLDRQQLVGRKPDGSLEMNNNHLWAEPLDTGVSRVTAANLSRLTRSINIQPIENFITLDYSALVEIRISRFEPDSAGSLALECTWKLQPVHGPASSPRPFKTTVPVLQPDPAMHARVAAMNEALAALAREISRSL